MDALSNRFQPGECLPRVLSFRAGEQGDKIAYTYLSDGENETAWYTYRQLYERSLGVAHELRSRRMEGERVLLAFEPGLEFIVGFFGCLYAGAIAVPCNFPHRPRQMPRLLSILEDCSPKAILTDERSLARLNNITTKASHENWDSLTKLVVDDIPPERDAPPSSPSLDDIAFLQYTSGSTSEPKGVIITHENLIRNLEMIRFAFRQDSSSLVVGWLPVHHDMGLIGNVLQPLYVGGQCVLMPPPTFIQKPVRWLSAVAKYRATTSGGPNFAYDLCVRRIGREDRAHLDLSSWSVAFNGSEPVRAETLTSFAEAFAECGFRVESFFPCYGLAEATLFVTGGVWNSEPVVRSVSRAGLARGQVIPVPVGDANETRLVGCGRPWLDQSIEIVDPERLTASLPNQVGEVWVAGPSIASGYWNRPEESWRVFIPATIVDKNKRLRTGDLGFLLDGTLFLTGRLKDLIIIRGRNLYPQDLELTAERAHHALEPAAGAAFSIDTEQGEQLVLVSEVRRTAQAAFDEIAQVVSQAIASEHEVTLFDFVLLKPGMLPRTTSGKVRRSECKIQYLEDRLEVVKSSRVLPSISTLDNSTVISPQERPSQSHLNGALSTVEEILLSIVSRKLQLHVSLIAPDTPLTAFGLDSLRGLELTYELEAQFGCSLPLSLLLESDSVRKLASRIVDLLPAGVDGSHQYAFCSSVSNRLSPGQHTLYTLERLSDGSSSNNLFIAGWVEGPLSIQALCRAAELLTLRHAALRTTFADESGGTPIVHETLALDFEQWQLQPEEFPQIRKLFEEEAHRPFDLNTRPLLRLRGCRLGEDRFALLFIIHHLVADLRSIEILLSDLGRLYEQEISGLPARLGDPPPNFAEFVDLQTSELASPKGTALREYWREALQNLPVIDLPADKPRPPVQTFRGAMRRRRLPAETLRETKELAREHGTTLFTVLITTLQCLLYRYTGQTDLVVGSPFSGRSNPRFSRSIGYFLNPLPFRADLTDNPSFEDMLARNKHTISEAFEHADFPSALMTEEMKGVFDPSRPPLFQVFFVFEQPSLPEFESLPAFILGHPGIRLQLGPLPMVSLELERRTSQFDLLLYAAEIMSEMQIAVEYNTDLFETPTIDRFMKCFQTMLESASRTPQRFISELEILGQEERETQLVVWNNPRESSPGRCLHKIFEDRVACDPAAIAVVDGLNEIRYSDLNDRAEALAQRIRRLSVGPEIPVALCFEPSIDMIIAILGVLKGGGAYLPLDTNQPPDRLQYILKDCICCTGLRVILTHFPVLKLAADLADAAGLELINCEQIEKPIDGAVTGSMAPEVLPDDLAYIIYTSGSTGRPKGVMNTHANIVRLFEETKAVFSFSASDVLTMFHSYGFDFSVWEMWGALLFGGRLVIVPYEVSRATQKFYDLLRSESVTILSQTPSAFRQLANLGEPWGERYGFRLRTVVFGGEAIDLSSLKSWLASYEGHTPTLVNMYGITETTVHVTYRALDRTDLEVNTKSLIGRQISDLQVYLLDSRQQLLPVGAVGAIYVGGAGLARGYLGKPDLTAERFVPNCLSLIPGDRLYQSGDLARYLPNGELEYLGRLDNQVKIRGHRIELGEIQYVLNGHPAIRHALVLADEDQYGDIRLLAYFTLNPSAVVTESDLRAYLKARLPSYMIPAALMALDSFPMTPNGKIDRRALPPPRAINQDTTIPSSESLTNTESILAAIWAELLGVVKPGRQDGFFDLGGHSLLATRMTNRIKEVFNVELPIATVFNGPALYEIATAIDNLRNAELGSAASQRIPAREIRSFSEEAPLSFSQYRLWFIDQLWQENAAYILCAARLRGTLSSVLLRCGLAEIVRRHEVLRTSFSTRDGKPIQVIQAVTEFKLDLIDLASLEVEEQEKRMLEIAREETEREFDLGRGPLIRARLLRLQGNENALFVNMHHIVSDGWSIEAMVRELTQLYEAFGSGKPSPLPELRIQYADFAIWQRTWLQGEVLERQLSFWKRQLAGVPVLECPTDRPRPMIASLRGDSKSFALPTELTFRLKELSRREGVTLFITLLAGFQIFLARYTGQEDIAIGTPIAGRNQEETKELVGFFVNTLVMRTDLSGAPTGREAIRRVREVCLNAYGHQDLPFEGLVEELQPQRDLNRNPIFQVMMGFQNELLKDLSIGGLKAEPINIPRRKCAFDLSLLFTDNDLELGVVVDYSTDLYNASTIEEIFNRLEGVLDWLVGNTEERLSSLSLLSQAERAEILGKWNDTAADYGMDRCLHELVSEQARRTPQAIAVISDDNHLSYEDLDRRSNRLSNFLVTLGVAPESLVGVYLDRSVEMVITLLGVLKAGGAYLPIDSTWPMERLAYIVANSKVGVLVTERRLLHLVAGLVNHVFCVDTEWDFEKDERLDSGSLPDNAAYVIYTSGSTGQPKGVINTHRGIVNRLIWMQHAFQLSQEDIVLQKTPFSFDVSLWEFFWPLSVGARLAIAKPEGHKDPFYLVNAIQDQRISTIHFVPSMLRNFLDQVTADRSPSLKRIICSGEELACELAQAVLNRLDVELHNLYGPTEAAVDVSWYAYRAGCPAQSVPIGKPIENMKLYVLDSHLQPLPPNMVGELFISGKGLARGYLGQADLTAERFLPHPHSSQGGTGLYRTGDIVRYLSDGNIEFLGRVDHQVKIRGNRIELGEIDSALRQHPYIKDVVVMARNYAGSDKRLVAYLVSDGEQKTTISEVREYLKRKLPDYMIPAAYVWLENLPINPNGKLDRRALPEPDDSSILDQKEYIAPRGPVEELISELWSEVLKVDRISIYDNFFDLGGHSLLLAQVAARIKETFFVVMPLRVLFDAPTISQLAVAIAAEQMRAAEASEAAQILEEIQRLSPDEIRALLEAEEISNPVKSV